MVTNLYNLITVNISLFVLIVLPFIPTAFLISRKKKWSGILLTSIVTGCTIQAITGFFWSHLFREWPYGEILLFGTICLGSILLSLRLIKLKKGIHLQPIEPKNFIFLALIIVAAIVVRSIHPLKVAYLGQSDAYVHLHYLNNIVESGYLVNPSYPSGYHWILALPVLVFSIDPYWVARFGGAFFGASLVLAVYVLLNCFVNRRAALFGSFCVACFPPMTLLIKTGVGAFANQLGLLLVPSILYLYIHIVTGDKIYRSDVVLFSCALCALVVSVPMMLIHLFLIIGVERLLALCQSPRISFWKKLKPLGLIIPAVCTFFFHLNQLGPYQRFQTANILMAYRENKMPVVDKLFEKARAAVDYKDSNKNRFTLMVAKSPYMRLVVDFFSIKRFGFGNRYINGAGYLLFTIFFVLICFGFLKKKIGIFIIGLWGGMTTIQASFGFLQFSSYQREGWSLLIATCCMGGILADRLYQAGAKWYLFNKTVSVILVGSFIWVIMNPPQHPMIHSSAEDLLVRSIRFIGQKHEKPGTSSGDNLQPYDHLAKVLKSDLPLTLVTRHFLGWGNQGEIAPNVLQKNSGVETLTVGNRMKKIKFQESRQYLIFIDKYQKLSPQQQLSAFAMVSPKMVDATLRHRRSLIRVNRRILKNLQMLPKINWQVNQMELSPHLSAYIVSPIKSRQNL